MQILYFCIPCVLMFCVLISLSGVNRIERKQKELEKRIDELESNRTEVWLMFSQMNHIMKEAVGIVKDLQP